jgi:deoxyribonuclease V
MGFLICVLDVAYAAEAAGVAGVLAESWTASSAVAEIKKRVASTPQSYEPGLFYKRELPLLQHLIAALELRPAVFVIDGYVWVGGNDRPGLGAHLFRSVGQSIPVVGVAKTPLRDDVWSTRALRGSSRRPLFVTAAGLDQTTAAGLVLGMHGAHRIPSLLQRADHLARIAAAKGE